jgi:hypothetical protein
LTGGFHGPAKLEQSDQGYNDRAEQVMVDIRYWHKADMLNALTNVRFWGKADSDQPLHRLATGELP